MYQNVESRNICHIICKHIIIKNIWDEVDNIQICSHAYI